MKPAPFDYVRPGSVEEAVASLAEAGDDAKLLAGGQSLMPLLTLRLARPTVLVDLSAIATLRIIDRVEPGTVRCGSMVTHAALTRQSDHELLRTAATWIGHDAIRTRGTIGGSLAHADPAAELPLVACATAGSFEIASPAGRRTLSADEFFVGPFESRLGHDDVLVAVDLPVPDRWGFAELARRHGDFGLVTVVVAETAGSWRIVIGGVSGVPHRAIDAESMLAAGIADEAGIDAVAATAAASVEPFDDVHATGAYRRALTEHLTRQALISALDPTGEARP